MWAPRPRSRRSISGLAGQGMAVLLISSELEEVVEGADAIIVLREGAIQGVLSGDEVSEDAVMNLIADAAQDADDHGSFDDVAG